MRNGLRRTIVTGVATAAAAGAAVAIAAPAFAATWQYQEYYAYMGACQHNGQNDVDYMGALAYRCSVEQPSGHVELWDLR